MKKTSLVVMLLVLAILLTACSGGNGLEGYTWKLTKDLGSYYTISFQNGTMVSTYVDLITGQQSTETAKYEIKGNKIIINGRTGEWSITGKILTLKDGDTVYSLERQ